MLNGKIFQVEWKLSSDLIVQRLCDILLSKCNSNNLLRAEVALQEVTADTIETTSCQVTTL